MNTQTQKIALITGGSRGLGRNTAESLARKGVDSVVTYHSRADEAQAVVAKREADGRKAVALQLDTGATKTFAGFVEKLKKTLQDTYGRPGGHCHRFQRRHGPRQSRGEQNRCRLDSTGAGWFAR